jgi:hypothetical protein
MPGRRRRSMIVAENPKITGARRVTVRFATLRTGELLQRAARYPSGAGATATTREGQAVRSDARLGFVSALRRGTGFNLSPNSARSINRATMFSLAVALAGHEPRCGQLE